MRSAHLGFRGSARPARRPSSTSRWSRSWPRARCSTRVRGSPSGSSSSATSSPSSRTSIHPVVRDIIRGGEKYTAVDAFARCNDCRSSRPWSAGCGSTWTCWCCRRSAPPSPSTRCWPGPSTATPMLGHYTHFGNLLDLLGVAVPLGVTADGRPASAMVLGPALSDDTVLHLAAQILDEPRAGRRAAAPTPVRHHLRGARMSHDHRRARRAVPRSRSRRQDRADRHRHAAGLPAARRLRRDPRQRRRPAAARWSRRWRRCSPPPGRPG